MRDQDEIYEAATEEPATLGCPSLVPGTVVVHDEPTDAEKTQSEQQREEARRKRKIVWKCYETKVDICVMGKTQQNGKVYEVRISKRQVAKISDTYAQCKVNGNVVLTCNFTGSAWMLRRILTAGMQALVNYKAKRKRDKRRANKNAKKGGAK